MSPGPDTCHPPFGPISACRAFDMTEPFGHRGLDLERVRAYVNDRTVRSPTREKFWTGRFRWRRPQMSNTVIVPFAAPGDASDSAKRRQIIEGARAVFLSQGFDAASMNDIARKAGVSKGTLYVYFRNKEELFEAITEQECSMQAEGVFVLDRSEE